MNDWKETGAVDPGSTASSLLRRVQSRDADAWGRLVDLYGPLVYHWCHQSRLRPEDAADVFQEVFRAVAAGIGKFHKDQPGDTFRGWLRTITRNKINDHFRKQQRAAPAVGGSDALRELHEVAAPGAEDDSSVPAENHDLLHRVLEVLRGEFEVTTWQAFWQVVVDEVLPLDVAARLNISINAVYKAKSRVLRRLREEMGELLE